MRSGPADYRIGEVVTGAWRLVLRNPGPLAAAMVLPLTIELAVQYGFLATYGAEMARQMAFGQQPDGGVLLRMLGMQVATLIAYGLFAVSWHRFILFGPAERPVVFPIVHSRHLRFILTTLGVSLLIGLIVGLPVGLLGGLRINSTILLLLIVVGAIAVFVRLQLVFPAIAVEKPMTLVDSWRATRGYGVRLFWASFLVMLPGVLVVVVLDELFGEAQGRFVMTGELTPAALLGYVADGVIGYVMLGLVVAVVSISFRILTGWQPPPAGTMS